jgi:hypothetical protein
MRKREAVVAALLISTILIIAMYYQDREQGRVVRYDCRLSEISPDYPVAVREACRKMRMERNHE